MKRDEYVLKERTFCDYCGALIQEGSPTTSDGSKMAAELPASFDFCLSCTASDLGGAVAIATGQKPAFRHPEPGAHYARVTGQE